MQPCPDDPQGPIPELQTMVLGSIPLKENIIPDTIVDPWLLFLLLSLWSYKIPGKDAGRDDNLSIRSDLHFFLIICFIQIYMFNFEKFLKSNLNILITLDVL